MSLPKRVEFQTLDGATLRGDYFPVDGKNSPMIVMTQGLTLLKEHYLPSWARKFQAAGIAALIYDHRGWGSSLGEPRNLVDIMQQAEEYHDAVLFVRTFPEIDPQRVAIWGIGHSGGASMIAAGDDPNVKAVILVMPFISGIHDKNLYPEGTLAEAWEARRAAVGLLSSGELNPYRQAWDTSEAQANGPRDGVLLHGPGPWQFRAGCAKQSSAAGTEWENRIALESFYRLSKVEPRMHIFKIAPRPLLYLTATDDGFSGPLEEHKKVFSMAGEPKQLAVLEGPHIDQYFDARFDYNVQLQIDFLKKYL